MRGWGQLGCHATVADSDDEAGEGTTANSHEAGLFNVHQIVNPPCNFQDAIDPFPGQWWWYAQYLVKMMSCSTCAHNGNLQIKPVMFHSCVDLLCLFWHACWLLWMYVGLIVWAVFSSMLSYMFCRKAILSSRNTLLNREHVASRMLHKFGWVMKPHELAWVVLWDTFFPLITRLK